jgi:Rieske Fe-S protein
VDQSTCTGSCACQSLADDTGSVSRRGVLTGSAAALAALALAACASPEESAGTATPTSSGSASPSPSDTATTAASPIQVDESASPTGDPLAGTGDFPVGGGVVVTTASGPVVVTHPTDTEFLAFNARCPHAGCPVAEVLENTIMCNCHGSTFDGSTGDRLEGPAPRGLEPVPIEVAGTEIYLA